jgi:Ca2+-transporting ATPase
VAYSLSLVMIVPIFVATSIGTGWAPQPGSLSDPTKNDPSRSSTAVTQGKVQIHPDIPRDDPAFKKWCVGEFSAHSTTVFSHFY